MSESWRHLCKKLRIVLDGSSCSSSMMRILVIVLRCDSDISHVTRRYFCCDCGVSRAWSKAWKDFVKIVTVCCGSVKELSGC